MRDEHNHYETLEVSQNASPEVLRAAYKSLMQRFHPDKHPDDSAIASRASRIAQAYAVLSEPGPRAAYDARLRQQQGQALAPRAYAPPRPTAAGSHRSSAPAAPSNWYVWLLAMVILASGGLMLVLSRHTPSAPPPRDARTLPRPPEAPPGAESPPTAAATNAPAPDIRHMALLASDLHVLLSDSDTYADGSESSRHRLSIPAVTLDIGSIEAEKFADTLIHQKEQVVHKLADKLAYARYSELKIEGDAYLRKYILEALREITGTQGLDDSAAPPANDTHRYGIVAVSLPASFALR